MGIIFDIKRFAVHDGPGIRTTVFLKGCPLSCQWCHNPESISSEICTVLKTVRMGDKLFTENETVGQELTVEQLMTEIRKEKIFMEESGGGVTFSGGEPLLQSEFLIEALKACKKEGIHTTVDTSGYASWSVLEKVCRHTDLFLYDLKMFDNNLHKSYTGVSNKVILENLSKLLSAGIKVRVRLPMVPNATFTDSNIDQTIEFLRNYTNQIEGVDLLPFHNTASHKYERFGINNNFANIKSITKNDLITTKGRFEEAGFAVKIGG